MGRVAKSEHLGEIDDPSEVGPIVDVLEPSAPPAWAEGKQYVTKHAAELALMCAYGPSAHVSAPQVG